MKKPMVDMMKKPKFDNLYTPESGTRVLCPYLSPAKVIWECTDSGVSGISKVLRSSGFTVVSSDIKTGFDFLNDTPDWKFDLIVSNPPYSQKNEFLARCYEYNVPFALLLPLTTLEGIERNKMFRENGLSVIVLDRRLDFTGKKNNWFNASWFCGGGFISKNTLIFEEVL